MRLVTYRKGSANPRVGALTADAVLDLGALAVDLARERGLARPAPGGRFGTMLELIAGGDNARSRAREALEHGLAVWKREGVDGLAAKKLGAPAAKIRLEAPIPRPPRNVFCLGRNYMEHAAERGAEAPAHPVYFTKAPECVLAPGGKIVHHPVTQELDYEVELAGRPETVETVHRAGVARADRLAHDDLPGDQLDRLVLGEDSGLAHPVVLVDGEPMTLDGAGHRASPLSRGCRRLRG